MNAAARLALAAAAAAALVGAAAQVPPTVRLAAAPAGQETRESQRPVEEVRLACPGADGQGIEDTEPLPMSVQVLAATPPADLVTPGPGEEAPLGAERLPAAGSAAPGPAPWTLTDASSLRLHATGRLARGTAALQLHLVGAGEQRALAATACGDVAATSYLVAGGPQPGRQERLVLTNPAAGTATVDLTVLDGAGAAPPVRHVVVPAGGRVGLLLDAIAPGVRAPVVQVRAASGAVQAALTDRWLDGITPRGGDVATPTVPGRDLVVPGVLAGGAPAGKPAVVRVAVPGAEDAVVELRAWTAQGQKGVPSPVTRIPAGGSADIEVSGLPEGSSAVAVHADVPVVAGAVSTVAGGAAQGSDLAWTAATPPVVALTGTPLPAAGKVDGTAVSAAFSIAAPQRTTVRVAEVDAAGVTHVREVTVPQTGTVDVPVTGASAWVLPGGAPVHVALLLRADAGGPLLAVAPLRERPTVERVLPVAQG